MSAREVDMGDLTSFSKKNRGNCHLAIITINTTSNNFGIFLFPLRFLRNALEKIEFVVIIINYLTCQDSAVRAINFQI